MYIKIKNAFLIIYQLDSYMLLFKFNREDINKYVI